MKINKWTAGLAAAGVVSLGSVVQAEESHNHVLTALSSTTLSGYINTSIHWNVNERNANAADYKFNSSKQDGFNLDVVALTLEKPLAEGDWAAGYRADLWFGPDASTLGTTPGTGLGVSGDDFAIKQAYVALRVPVGNGIDVKVGVFDTIIGYESVDAPRNPNYTRSYGHSIEPQTHTGVLGTYRFCQSFAASFGVANTVANSAINNRDGVSATRSSEWYKAYMASIALTAPEDWGALKGSTLYGGVVSGGINDTAAGGHRANWYAGATIGTPVEGLSVGVAYDLLDIRGAGAAGGSPGADDASAIAAYLSFKASEKLTLSARGEYFVRENGANESDEIYAITTTIQYDLWQNVLSRLEVRWDHSPDGKEFGGSGAPSNNSELLIAANIIYKF